MNMTKPTAGEYAPYYGTYIDRVQNDNLLEALHQHTDEFIEFICRIPAHKGDYAYATGKWTVKEVLLHIIDAERIFAYRALRFGRNDQTELPGFEENDYVPYSNAAARSLLSLQEEFAAVRQATLTLFRSFDESAWMRSGVASKNPMSVRALGFVIIGHAEHHRKVLEERYW
ncbi:MAG: DinB family protein [Bacteroidetes bacterium]|nr:DinB family protein [Bacteroidota bacterium]